MFVTCFSDGPSRMSPLDRLHAVAHAQAQAQAQAERRGSEHYSGVTSSDKPVALTTHLHGNHGKPEDLLHSPPTSIADFTGNACSYQLIPTLKCYSQSHVQSHPSAWNNSCERKNVASCEWRWGGWPHRAIPASDRKSHGLVNSTNSYLHNQFKC